MANKNESGEERSGTVEITADNDPLAKEPYNYDPMLTVPEVMDLLDVSDGTCRAWLKERGLELKVRGCSRIPRLALSRVLFGQGDPVGQPDDKNDSVIDFPEAASQ